MIPRGITGWKGTFMTLIGVICHLFKDLEKSILCKVEFGLYNVGLPPIMTFCDTGTRP